MGTWTVVAGVEGSDMLLLARNHTLIQVPQEDVVKVGSYDPQSAAKLARSIRTRKDLERVLDVHSVEENDG